MFVQEIGNPALTPPKKSQNNVFSMLCCGCFTVFNESTGFPLVSLTCSHKLCSACYAFALKENLPAVKCCLPTKDDGMLDLPGVGASGDRLPKEPSPVLIAIEKTQKFIQESMCARHAFPTDGICPVHLESMHCKVCLQEQHIDCEGDKIASLSSWFAKLQIGVPDMPLLLEHFESALASIGMRCLTTTALLEKADDFATTFGGQNFPSLFFPLRGKKFQFAEGNLRIESQLLQELAAGIHKLTTFIKTDKIEGNCRISQIVKNIEKISGLRLHFEPLDNTGTESRCDKSAADFLHHAGLAGPQSHTSDFPHNHKESSIEDVLSRGSFQHKAVLASSSLSPLPYRKSLQVHTLDSKKTSLLALASQIDLGNDEKETFGVKSSSPRQSAYSKSFNINETVNSKRIEEIFDRKLGTFKEEMKAYVKELVSGQKSHFEKIARFEAAVAQIEQSVLKISKRLTFLENQLDGLGERGGDCGQQDEAGQKDERLRMVSSRSIHSASDIDCVANQLQQSSKKRVSPEDSFLFPSASCGQENLNRTEQVKVTGPAKVKNWNANITLPVDTGGTKKLNKKHNLRKSIESLLDGRIAPMEPIAELPTPVLSGSSTPSKPSNFARQAEPQKYEMHRLELDESEFENFRQQLKSLKSNANQPITPTSMTHQQKEIFLSLLTDDKANTQQTQVPSPPKSESKVLKTSFDRYRISNLQTDKFLTNSKAKGQNVQLKIFSKTCRNSSHSRPSKLGFKDSKIFNPQDKIFQTEKRNGLKRNSAEKRRKSLSPKAFPDRKIGPRISGPPAPGQNFKKLSANLRTESIAANPKETAQKTGSCVSEREAPVYVVDRSTTEPVGLLESFQKGTFNKNLQEAISNFIQNSNSFSRPSEPPSKHKKEASIQSLPETYRRSGTPYLRKKDVTKVVNLYSGRIERLGDAV